METKTLAYTIRVSQKARHVRFQVSPERGLEVIIPKRFDPAKVAGLVRKNSRWIERAIAKTRILLESRPLPEVWQLPVTIHFPAVDQGWSVAAQKLTGQFVRLHERPGQILELLGAVDDENCCREVLSQWLTRRGAGYLTPWIKRISEATGLSFTRLSIKQQKTRWGSCSHRKAISLNARLLFLPRPLVEYILVHELCHTKELNHSAAFWKLVESYLPDCRQRDQELKVASRFIPRWLS